MKSFFRRKRERNLTSLGTILATRYVPVMAYSAIFFFSFFLSLSLHVSADNPNDICPATSCHRGRPEIRFPFRLRDVPTDVAIRASTSRATTEAKQFSNCLTRKTL